MIAVGIDVSKGKSTVAILDGDGSIRAHPYEMNHSKAELDALIQYIIATDDHPIILMEPTGHYHYPVLKAFLDAGLSPSLVNPYLLKNGKYYNVYFSTPKIKSLEDIKTRHLKRASAASKYFEEIADVTFRPKDAPAEENIQLLYDSIFKENIEGKKAV